MQYDFGTIDTGQTDGVELAAMLEGFRDALHSMHSGNTAPSYAVKGMLWLDTSATPHPIKLSDGSDWIQIGDLNPSTNVFRPNLAGVGLGALAYKSLVTAGDITDGVITTAKLASGFMLGIDKGGTGASTAAAARTALGLAIGSNVQAFHANLAAEAGLVGAVNKLAYYTGAGAKTLADLSPFARTLLDDADATAARATLGIGGNSGALLGQTLFTASGTWTKATRNPSFIIVEVIGGGGGGARGGGLQGGAGGGAGGYARKLILASALGATETVTIGAGGAGGGNGPSGGTGGTSSFGAQCSATGGAGATYGNGSGSISQPGAGGTGSNGDLNLIGAPGNGATMLSGTNKFISGHGGAGYMGLGAGRGVRETDGQGGHAQANTGAGGSGCGGANSGSGGNGGSGLVIIWEYA